MAGVAADVVGAATEVGAGPPVRLPDPVVLPVGAAALAGVGRGEAALGTLVAAGVVGAGGGAGWPATGMVVENVCTPASAMASRVLMSGCWRMRRSRSDLYWGDRRARARAWPRNNLNLTVEPGFLSTETGTPMSVAARALTAEDTWAAYAPQRVSGLVAYAYRTAW